MNGKTYTFQKVKDGFAIDLDYMCAGNSNHISFYDITHTSPDGTEIGHHGYVRKGTLTLDEKDVSFDCSDGVEIEVSERIGGEGDGLLCSQGTLKLPHGKTRLGNCVVGLVDYFLQTGHEKLSDANGNLLGTFQHTSTRHKGKKNRTMTNKQQAKIEEILTRLCGGFVRMDEAIKGIGVVFGKASESIDGIKQVSGAFVPTRESEECIVSVGEPPKEKESFTFTDNRRAYSFFGSGNYYYDAHHKDEGKSKYIERFTITKTTTELKSFHFVVGKGDMEINLQRVPSPYITPKNGDWVKVYTGGEEIGILEFRNLKPKTIGVNLACVFENCVHYEKGDEKTLHWMDEKIDFLCFIPKHVYTHADPTLANLEELQNGGWGRWDDLCLLKEDDVPDSKKDEADTPHICNNQDADTPKQSLEYNYHQKTDEVLKHFGKQKDVKCEDGNMYSVYYRGDKFGVELVGAVFRGTTGIYLCRVEDSVILNGSRLNVMDNERPGFVVYRSGHCVALGVLESGEISELFDMADQIPDTTGLKQAKRKFPEFFGE